MIYLIALAGRVGTPLSLGDWDRLDAQVPCLLNLQPSGKYLMEDFYFAGGLPLVMCEISYLLHLDCLTVNGRTSLQCVLLQPRSDQDTSGTVHAGRRGQHD